MIGYPSGHDGAILPAGDYALCPARKICCLSHTRLKTFVDCFSSVQVARYWLPSFLRVFVDLDSVSVHKNAKHKQTKKSLANIQLSCRLASRLVIRPSPTGTTMHSGKDFRPSKLGTSKMAAQLTDEVCLFSLFC